MKRSLTVTNMGPVKLIKGLFVSVSKLNDEK
jgi:hypothetical protein